VAQDEGDLLLGAKVGDPVPGVHALGAEHEVVAERRKGPEERLGAGGDVLVEDDGAVLIEDAEVKGSGVEIGAAVESVRTGVNTPSSWTPWEGRVLSPLTVAGRYVLPQPR
jgi:hypothetical protein